MKLFTLLFSVLFIATGAYAEPTLSPSSGEIDPDQTFTYSANGTAVQDFWIYIGTTSGARDVVDSGSAGPTDSAFVASNLPNGSIFFTLWYKVSNTWQRGIYEFSIPVPSVSETLASELSCATGELIRATPTDWECVDSDSLAGPDYADELCRLYRYEGATPPSSLVCPSDNDRYVFVTQGTFNGELGGLKNADAICQVEADQASLPGVYKAFLSEEYTPVASRLRLLEGVTYKKPNNIVVASTLEQLYNPNTSLSSPIDRYATGAAATGQALVWTGGYGGSAADCNAWTGSGSGSFAFTGIKGSLNATNSSWLNTSGSVNAIKCTNQYRLYCFEM